MRAAMLSEAPPTPAATMSSPFPLRRSGARWSRLAPAAIGQELGAEVDAERVIDLDDRRDAACHVEDILAAVPRPADVDDAGRGGRLRADHPKANRDHLPTP